MNVSSENSEERQGHSSLRQKAIIIVSLIPVVLLLVLLAWGMARSERHSSGFSVNSNFTEIPLETQRARDFAGATFDDEDFRLSDTLGKIVMLDFWASWCPPCRIEAPDLAQVYQEYQHRGVEFVGIAIWDDADDLTKHIERFQITYPNILDNQGGIAIDYGVSGIPEKYFIDTQGNVIKRLSGPTTAGKLREILDILLEL